MVEGFSCEYHRPVSRLGRGPPTASGTTHGGHQTVPTTIEKALSKTQLAATLASQHGLTKQQAIDILDTIATLAHSETKSKGEFTLPGIGKLVRQERPARTGRNPATG